MITIEYRPCKTTRITSPFGFRINPVTHVEAFHLGIDISPIDKVKLFEEPIISIGDGIVSEVGHNNIIGNYIRIAHKGYESRYNHLSKSIVNENDNVWAGQEIGNMGTTGSSTSQHLHFELRINKTPMDPTPYILNKPFEIKGEPMTRQEIEDLIKEILIGTGDIPSAWANEMWHNAIKEGITDGTRPKGYATREEVVALIVKSKV